ncbi:MAG TPA: hypothetical protein VGH38_15525 [Bryobacteraceae bacterium]
MVPGAGVRLATDPGASPGGLSRRSGTGQPSKKGTGFEQPLAAHQHWHMDVSYINVSGTFYYLCSVLECLFCF